MRVEPAAKAGCVPGVSARHPRTLRGATGAARRNGRRQLSDARRRVRACGMRRLWMQMNWHLGGGADAAELERLLSAMRPKLHRYCARMVGSVIDGEDVLQDALIKALEAFRPTARSPIPRDGCSASLTTPRWISCAAAAGGRRCKLPRRWTWSRIRSTRRPSRQIAAASLRTFMRLPVAQRSSVILMDVLGCSLQEVCEIWISACRR